MTAPPQIPLRFATGNHLEGATITVTPEPAAATPIAHLVDERANRQVIWAGLERDVVIDIVPDQLRATSVLALLGDTLAGLDQARLNLYADDAHTALVYSTGFVPLAEPLPVETWRAGVDEFGSTAEEDRPSVYMQWLPEPIAYRSARLVIRRAEDSSGETLALRAAVLGEMLEFERNFAFGVELEYFRSEPARELASGRHAYARPWRPSRRLTLTLPAMTDGDRQQLSRMLRRLAGAPFLVSAFSGSSGWEHDDYSMLCVLEDSNAYRHVRLGRHSTDLVLLEA